MGVMKRDHAVKVDLKNFVEHVSQELELRSWTWADLSRAAGVLDSTLSHLKNKLRIPCLDAYLSICEALSIDPMEFVVRKRFSKSRPLKKVTS